MSEYTHLWNDMPFDERKRLMPYMIETHILHLTQTRATIVAAHQCALREIDDQIKNLRQSLAARDTASAQGE